MMKRDAYLIGLGTCMVLTMGMLAGCSSGKKAQVWTAQKQRMQRGRETAEGDVIKIISAGNNPEEHFKSIAMDAFEQYVEEHSNGTMQVETYPNQQMGADGEVLEGTQLGKYSGWLCKLLQCGNGILDKLFIPGSSVPVQQR